MHVTYSKYLCATFGKRFSAEVRCCGAHEVVVAAAGVNSTSQAYVACRATKYGWLSVVAVFGGLLKDLIFHKNIRKATEMAYEATQI